jgi:predicted metalloprotease with PDZ domain
MRFLRLVSVVVFVVGVVCGQGSRLHYTVEVKEGDDTAYRCKVDIRHPDRDLLRFSVAAWAPGSYRLLNQAQNIVNVKATAPDGAEIPVSKEGDLTWMFSAGGRPHVTLSWDFKAPGKARNNRSYLTKTGALLDGPRTWLYWRDRKDLSAHVSGEGAERVECRDGTRTHVRAECFRREGHGLVARLPDPDGQTRNALVFVEGVPVRVAVEMGGRKPEFDMDAFADVCRRITEAEAKMWRRRALRPLHVPVQRRRGRRARASDVDDDRHQPVGARRPTPRRTKA